MDNSMRPNSFKTLKHTLSWLYVWGIAFGYIEAAIVIYLRKIYYPDGFRFPIVLADIDIAAVEMLRELMTLIIILAVAELTFRTFLKKFAACMIIFGIWDIFYYLFLKIYLDWPESFFTWDILFLIPLPWVGPVLAPVLVSLALIYAGIIILVDMSRGYKFQFNKRFWIMEIMAGIIIIISFMISGTVVINQTIPASFPWIIFLVGLFFGLVVFHYCLVKDSNVLSDP